MGLCQLLSARGIDMQCATLGMASSSLFSGMGALDNDTFLAKWAQGRQQTWDGPYLSPMTASSQGT